MENTVLQEIRKLEETLESYLVRKKELEDDAEQISDDLADLSPEQIDKIVEDEVFDPLWKKLGTDYYHPEQQRVYGALKTAADQLARQRPTVPPPPAGYPSWDSVRDEIARQKTRSQVAWNLFKKEKQALIPLIRNATWDTVNQMVNVLGTPRQRFSSYMEEIQWLCREIIPEKFRPFLCICIEHCIDGSKTEETFAADSPELSTQAFLAGYKPSGYDLRPRLSFSWGRTIESYTCTICRNQHTDTSLKEFFANNHVKAQNWLDENTDSGRHPWVSKAENLLNQTLRYCLYRQHGNLADQKIKELEEAVQQHDRIHADALALDTRVREAEAKYKGLVGADNKLIRKKFKEAGLLRQMGAEERSRVIGNFAASCKRMTSLGISPGDLPDVWWLFYESADNYAQVRKRLSRQIFDKFQQERAEKEAIRQQLGSLKEPDWRTAFRQLSLQDPVMLPAETDASPQEIVSAVARAAASRTTVPELPLPQYERNGAFLRPVIVPWHRGTQAANIRLACPTGEMALGNEILKNLLLGMLLSLPPGSVRLRLVDLNLSGQASFLTMNLPPELYHGAVISSEAEFRNQVADLQKHIASVSARCANVIPYNAGHGEILTPYEVVVLLDFPKNISAQHVKALLPLLENGYKAGVSFVVMDDEDAEPERGVAELRDAPSFHRVGIRKDPHGSTAPLIPLAADDDRNAAFFRYLREGYQQTSRTKVIAVDSQSLAQEPYADASDGVLSVEVGREGDKTVDFVLNQEDHVHAFVIGKSGSGKSVFLRDIILGAAMKYAPEDLSLYLIDLKVGGVEFNGYQELPHTKAALLDDSDRQIVLEILRDIRAEIKRRGEVMRAAESSKLQDYNRAHRQDRMSQVVVVVDECQRLFDESRRDRLQTEIADIVDEIATQGRAFGVHLLLSTQTLRGSMISAKVKENVSDFYLLKGGMADGMERLADQTAALQTGQVLYADHRNNRLFQAYFLGGDEKGAVIGKAARKAEGHRDNGRFVFMGKMIHAFGPDDVAALRRAARRSAAFAAGKAVSLDLSPVVVPLKDDMSENVLVIGTDKRTAADLAQQTYLSVMAGEKAMGREGRFLCIDCMDDPELPYYDLSDRLADYGSELVPPRERGKVIRELAGQVRSGQAEPTTILLLGQERFTQLLVGAELPDPTAAAPAAEAEPARTPSFLQGVPSGGLRSTLSKPATFRSELQFLLENGPEQGVHFIWQVDRLPNLLGESSLSKQSILRMFRHLLLLRSPGESVLRLGLSAELDPEQLSTDPERLRAYYINLLDAQNQLLTPYRASTADELTNLLL